MCQCKEIKQRLSNELDALIEFSHTSYVIKGCACKGITIHLSNGLNERTCLVVLLPEDLSIPENITNAISLGLDGLY